MDLGTVKDKLAGQLYCCAGQVVQDIRLVFTNALRYNKPGQLVHSMAEAMQVIFEVRSLV